MINRINPRVVHAAPLQNLAVFDLDNCLTDDGWRYKFIDWQAANPDDRWRAYHQQCFGDNPANLETFHAVVAVSGFYPVFITARTEEVRVATERWLRQNLGVELFTLLMRAEGDHRPTLQVKVEHVRSLPRQPVLAFDDREDIVKAYRDLGIDAKVLRVHDTCMMTPPPGVTAARLLTDRRTAQGVPLEPGEEPMPLAPPTRGEGVASAERPAAPVGDGMAPEASDKTPADVLIEMGETFRERNKVYGSNYKMVGPLVKVLFPDGVPPELVASHRWHLFELKLVKLSRFAISGLKHLDSIHDDAVYSAMIESILINGEDQ